MQQLWKPGLEPVKLQRIKFLLIACLVTTACSDRQPEKAEYYVFGTLVEVSVAGADPETTQQAFLKLQQLFQYMHRDWHAWEAGQLSDINQAIANSQDAIADPQIAELIRQSGEFETATGGRFNASIGKLVGLWGFHTSEYPIHGPIPAKDQIAGLLAANPSALDIQLQDLGNEQWRISSDNPDVQLDFGGIAKGYAVDLAIALLRSMGVNHAIVNAGGDLRAIGNNRGPDWRVAVENPLGGIIGVLAIDSDESVFTSGNYQRFGLDDSGIRFAHILDPATGQPVSDVLSATVISHNGITADAAATALVVAGLDEWPGIATGMELEQFLITDEHGNIFMTRALQSRLEFAAGVKSKVLLLD